MKREYIAGGAGTEEVKPCQSSGVERIFHMIFLYFIFIFAIVGTVYAATQSVLLVIFGLLVCYYLENMLFVFGHIGFHAAFIEYPEKKMSTLSHHSFIHHYRRIQVYHETWLETRISYFFCPKKYFRSPVTLGHIIPQCLTGLILFLINPILGIAALSFIWLMHLLQAICHEWYHNRDRENFYVKPLHYLMLFLEKIGIMSRKKHAEHHKHGLDNLHQVSLWLDMYIPGGEAVGNFIWKKTLAKYKKGEYNMTDFIRKIFYVYIFLNHLILIAMFCLFGYLWL